MPLYSLCLSPILSSPSANDLCHLRLTDGVSVKITEQKGGTWQFSPAFAILYSTEDPKLALRPFGLQKLGYKIVRAG